MARGKVKYADAVRGYGYIVPDGAQDAHDSVYFEADDTVVGFDDFRPGQEVDYAEVRDSDGTRRAEGVAEA